MAPDLAEIVGRSAGSVPVAWNQRDLILYAIAIGARYDELDLVYELRKDWKPFPTYPAVLVLKGTSSDVVDYVASLAPSYSGEGILGALALDTTRMLQLSFDIKFLRPLPREGLLEDTWKIEASIGGVHTKRRGLLIEHVWTLVDGSGAEYCYMRADAFYFGDFNFNGLSKSVSPKLSVEVKDEPPSRAADVVHEDCTTTEQALIFRLCGDYNPHCVDPAVNKSVGIDGAILHGACSHGIAAHAIVKSIARGDTTRLSEMTAKFTNVVLPGQTLVTHMWTKARNDGDIEVDFAQQIKETGKWCLTGCALLKGGHSTSKL